MLNCKMKPLSKSYTVKTFNETFNETIKFSSIQSKILYANILATPLGEMLAIADERKLYLLEFANWRNLKREILSLRKKTSALILSGNTPPLLSIKQELSHYFKGNLKNFKTPICYNGSVFQIEVWKELKKIPYGQTRSYADIAMLLGKPTAYRAVANANGKNLFAIVIPCHRVINHNGGLGGYGGGLERKKWLLQHEK